MADATNIVWLRQDLRLSDNPALAKACERGGRIVVIYVLDDEAFGDRKPGAAQRWWLHHSLAALADALRRRGGQLVLRRGRAAPILEDLVARTQAKAVYWNRCYDQESIARDRTIKRDLAEAGLEVESFSALLLAEPWEARNKEGQHFKVFSAFWRSFLRNCQVAPPLPAPAKLTPVPGLSGDRLEDWELTPRNPDWAAPFGESWTPGEAGAKQALDRFLEGGLASYKQARDRPDRQATSRLSPHLRFGEISPREIWQAVHDRLGVAGASQAGADKFLAELGWREFSYSLLFHEADLARRPLRREFERFPWQPDPTALRAWQRGRTGFPIVDAGMRELWACGWMHNRVRMIAASFLVKDLLIPWQEGEAWFWDTLVDADPANNTASWQWVAGCGADAAPYFRIFNPVLQGERFDPEGAYVRRWVPELSDLPNKVIHKPWEASEADLEKAGVRLGGNYPERLVDHGLARLRALEAFETLKKERAA